MNGNIELGIQKEGVTIYFKIKSRCLLGGTKENHANIIRYRGYANRNLSQQTTVKHNYVFLILYYHIRYATTCFGLY